MAANYYTGSVSSFAGLLTAMTTGCAAHGWSWDGTILSKSGLFIRPYVSTAEASSEGAGLLAELGTGRSGSAITGGSGCIPRLGRPGGGLEAVVWPATYHLFVFDDPSEVFLVLQFNVNRHYWMAFGASAINGGPWISATAGKGYTASTASSLSIAANSGGSSSSANRSGLPFWKSTAGPNTAPVSFSETVRSQVDAEWGGFASGNGVGFLNGVLSTIPMNQRLPSNWNQAAVLLPINVYQRRASDFWSMVLSVRNARYVRVDYYEPGQIITLGHEQWMIFPGYRKDLANRDGPSTSGDHTGTMGWAIRYQPDDVGG